MQRSEPELDRVWRIGSESFGDAARRWTVSYQCNACHYRAGEPPTQVLRACGGVLLVLFHPGETEKLTDDELRRELRAAWDEEFSRPLARA
jgi:hypothetical protein